MRWKLLPLLVIALSAMADGELVGGRMVYELVVDALKSKVTPQQSTPPAAQEAGRALRTDVWQTVSVGDAAGGSGGSCEVLHWDRSISNTPYLSVEKPGKYCLDQDYEMECSAFSHGCNGQLIDVRANDIDIDFRGHKLRVRGTRAYGGVWALGRNIRIHNGTIDGGGTGVTLTQGRGSVSPKDAVPWMPVKPDPHFEPTGFRGGGDAVHRCRRSDTDVRFWQHRAR